MDTDFLSTKLTKSNENINQENGKLCLAEYNEKPKADIQNKMLEIRNKAFQKNKNLICNLQIK
jgi:hypothetical protein